MQFVQKIFAVVLTKSGTFRHGHCWFRTIKFLIFDPRRPNLSPKSSMQCIACESNTEFVFFWILVSFSTLKLNDLIWAKNAKSWIPSSSSWGPINVAHLKNFGILDRHALQFLSVYSSVHPSIFKSYVFWVLQKLKWIWNLFVFW